METLANTIEGLPVISLQSSETVAWLQHPVISAASLRVMAFNCQTPVRRPSILLLWSDIRQFASDCVIVDREDELTEAADLIRLQPTVQAAYTPMGQPVVTDLGRRLGTVENYTLDLDTGQIHRLHIRQSLLHSWLGTHLIVDSNQIVDVSPHQITVSDTTMRSSALQAAPLPTHHP